MMGIALLGKMTSRFPKRMLAAITVVIMAGTGYAAKETPPHLKRRIAEKEAMTRLRSFAESADRETVVFTPDHRSPNWLKIYFDFKYPERLRVEAFTKERFEELASGRRVLFYANKSRFNFMKRIYKAKTDSYLKKWFYALRHREGVRKLYSSNGIVLYLLQ